MKRFTALVVALLLVAGVAYAGRDTTTTRLVALADGRTVPVTMTPQQAQFCLPKPTLMDRGTRLASDLGSIVPALLKPLPLDRIRDNAAGAWFSIGNWIGVWAAAVEGRPQPEPVVSAVDCAALLDPCKAATPNPAQPHDPNSASLTGPALAADALRKAGFPPAEIPTFVAIAKHETGFRNITGPTVGAGTMRGMWQLNDQYWKLDNWQDPYANARKAKEVRDESMHVRGNPYYPWSTWRAAVRDAGDYAQYGEPAAAAGGGGVVAAAAVAPAPTDPRGPLTATPETSTTDQCAPTSGGLGVTIGSWNVLYTNTKNNVEEHAGFADLVGLQEIRDRHRVKRPGKPATVEVPGYSATPGSMAVPIIWRNDRLELVRWDRQETLTGSVHKWVVFGVWRNRSTGQQFAAVNTHQYVNGGPKWAEQARRVDAVVDRLKKTGMPVILLGDMNAAPTKVQDFFGFSGVGGRIDRVVAFGVKASKTERLSAAGSDHRRIRATFPAPKAAAGTGGTVGLGAAFTDAPSGRTTMDGKAVSRVVAAQIELAERKSGINFTVMQGGFGGGDVPASGSSHDWPGVVDLSPGTVEAEEALRRAGFASWARNIPGRSYAGSGAHNHAVSLLDPGNKGHGQLSSWERGGNGLDGGTDPAPHYPLYPELSGLAGR